MTMQGRLGAYELVEPLGSGAMGEVYKATDSKMFDRSVAIKLLPDRFSRNRQAQERFRREIQVAAGLQHPNIVTIHDHGTFDGRLYYVMEFIDGVRLSQVIADRQGYPLSRRVDIAAQICSGLQFIHQAGIVHRDLKPGNVMVTRHGSRDQVKLLDFGIAQVAESDLTRPEAQPGTASYMSPEQARGEGVDLRSDIFSLGIVLYELLAGVYLFSASTETLVTVGILQETPIAMTEIRPDVPAELSSIVARALAKDPSHRPSAAGEIEATLESAHKRLIAHAGTNEPTIPMETSPAGGGFRPDTADPGADPMDCAPTTMPEYDPPTDTGLPMDQQPAAGDVNLGTAVPPSTPTPLPGASQSAGDSHGSRLGPAFWLMAVLILVAAVLGIWRGLSSWTSASTTNVVNETPPAVPEAPVATGTAIRTALERWRVAYETRSVDAILEVFPNLEDPGGMRLYLSRMQWLQMTTDDIRISERPDGDTATAECAVSMKFLNVGASEPSEVALRSRFDLLRIDDGVWRISHQEFME